MFSRALLTCLDFLIHVELKISVGQLLWRAIAQAAVRSLALVLLMPVRNLSFLAVFIPVFVFRAFPLPVVAELTHFFFLLLSATRMLATFAAHVSPTITRVFPEIE